MYGVKANQLQNILFNARKNEIQNTHLHRLVSKSKLGIAERLAQISTPMDIAVMKLIT